MVLGTLHVYRYVHCTLYHVQMGPIPGLIRIAADRSSVPSFPRPSAEAIGARRGHSIPVRKLPKCNMPLRWSRRVRHMFHRSRAWYASFSGPRDYDILCDVLRPGSDEDRWRR